VRATRQIAAIVSLKNGLPASPAGFAGDGPFEAIARLESNSPCFDCRLAVFKRRFDTAAAGFFPSVRSLRHDTTRLVRRIARWAGRSHLEVLST
jgi:hypothetical protein